MCYNNPRDWAYTYGTTVKPLRTMIDSNDTFQLIMQYGMKIRSSFHPFLKFKMVRRNNLTITERFNEVRINNLTPSEAVCEYKLTINTVYSNVREEERINQLVLIGRSKFERYFNFLSISLINLFESNCFHNFQG